MQLVFQSSQNVEGDHSKLFSEHQLGFDEQWHPEHPGLAVELVAVDVAAFFVSGRIVEDLLGAQHHLAHIR